LEEWFDTIGFQMEVEDVVREFEHIDFCQSSPVFTLNGWIMVRDPRKAMPKDLTCLHGFSSRQEELVWLQSVSDCGLALTAGVPVYGAFYSMFKTGQYGKNVESLEDRGIYRLSRGMEELSREVTDEARVSFTYAFGINPDEQVELENYFSKIKLSTYQGDVPTPSEEFVLPSGLLS
jgi:hypothetical protein